MNIDAFKKFPPIKAEIAQSLQLKAHWQQLCEDAPVFDAIADEQQLEILHAWAGSEFISRWCARAPMVFAELWLANVFGNKSDAATRAARVQQAIAEPGDETDLMAALRRVRNQEMAVIAWQDITATVRTEETLAALTQLAELLIQLALDWLHQDLLAQKNPSDYPSPPRLIVLGMGKLGGGELNFSSDIDLIFSYRPDGRDHSKFLTRLGQRLIHVLNTTTADGFVYRVDMRLRPFGDAGALVSSVDAMGDYYQHHGREWERYALLKARPVAGDSAGGITLLNDLQEFIYRRYLDYGSLESLRDIKQLIAQEARRKGQSADLKVGPGGIREVEFTTQVFQLTYGGMDKDLRTPQLLAALAQIEKRQLLPAAVTETLRSGYLYLRRTENHLQMIADQQVHSLPGNDIDRWRLAHNRGHADWEPFIAELNQHRDAVNQHFSHVFESPDEGDDMENSYAASAAFWGTIGDDQTPDFAVLKSAGYADPEQTNVTLQKLSQDRQITSLPPSGRKRLDQVMPAIIEAAGQTADAEQTLLRVSQIISTVAQRTAYLSLLGEQPEVLKQLVRLCAASPWIASYLGRQPILLDELINPKALFNPPDREGLRAELNSLFARIEPEDEEQILNGLRHFKHAQVFRVAAADIVGALPVTKVSDHLTWIAEVTLEKVLELAWGWLKGKHGLPQYEAGGETRNAQFCILGYGKLGGLEMGYGSDLDIVFLHDSHGTKQQTTGERQLDNSTFFARLGQRIIHLLSVFTQAGELYDVDIRLRPSGASGLLVSSLEAFLHYQQNDAWTWEHQALIRARPVAGSKQLAAAFRRARCKILSQKRDAKALQEEIAQMRARMWQETKLSHPGLFDLKKSPGGITDIEFMVQYWVLENAHRQQQLCAWTDNIRLLETLADQQTPPVEVARNLTEAYIALRNEIHRRDLQSLPTAVDSDFFAAQQAMVKQCWNGLFGETAASS